jgi:hypothetical protein
MNDNTLIFDTKGIATGNTQEDYKSRKKFITGLAVTFLTEILENSRVKKDKKGNILLEIPKTNVKNQERFSKIFTMFYEKLALGKIKLTVGELRGSGQKVQYCITTIEND